MKSWLKIGVWLLAVLLIVGTVAPVFAMSLEDYYKELERINKERQELKAKEKTTKNELAQLGLELEELNLELGQATYRLEQLNQQIEEQQALINQQEIDIENKKQEIADTEDYLAEQMGYLEQRMRAMYKNGTVNYLEVLFAATSFSDFLSRLKFLSTIIDSDANLINDVRETRDWLVQEKIELEAQLVLLMERKAQLEVDRAAAQEEEKRISVLAAEREEKQSQLQKTMASIKEQIGGLDEKAEEFNAEITKLLDAEKWKSGEAPSVFLWPVPVTRYVSSPFGWRTIYGKPDWHRGIDIAPSHRYYPSSPMYQGTPAYIVAAASGEVVTSKYHSSYGWYVIIAHGGGYATLYAHQYQKPMVSEGDIVAIGQPIGIVGSTGQSTGPHLHFEVRVNGQPVDPLKFEYK